MIRYIYAAVIERDMKKIILFITLISANYFAGAQVIEDQRALTSAFLAAKTMANALVLKNYGQYIDYNHPKVIEGAEGGREGMITMVRQQVASIEEAGNIVTAAWPNKPAKIIDTADEWQCAMQQYVEYRLPGGKIVSETTIIGISPNNGENWYFVDAADRKLSQIRELFPKLSSQLVIPPPAEPVFTADKK